QTPLDQPPEELAPERLGLRLADVKTDDLPASGLVHGVRDHHTLARHPAAVADLLHLRINKQIRVAALQWPGAEGLDLLIQAHADPRHLTAANSQTEALDQLVDAAGGDAAHVRLLHPRHQRLLRALAR